MKTEKQVVEIMEKTVGQVEKLVGECGDNPTEDQKMQMCTMLGTLFALGIVLDCEDEIKQVTSILRLAAAGQKMAAAKEAASS